MGPFEFVFLILLILKLTEKVAWSWWIIFSPLLIEIGIIAGLIATFGVAGFLTLMSP